jgi:glycosyltransferase involved in cell wall biosynthesis
MILPKWIASRPTLHGGWLETIMISFIVPAHNEESCLGRTLQTIHDSARVAGCPYEIIVADDASTDATAEVAKQNNARVVSVNHRQIAATRNAGARAATGERLFFVDADTIINSRVVASALRCMDKGAVGGGRSGENSGRNCQVWNEKAGMGASRANQRGAGLNNPTWDQWIG